MVEGLFYNPNIYPFSEYNNRKESVARLSVLLDFRLHLIGEYTPDHFLGNINFREKQRRCPACWSLRINETAGYAARSGFDGFTTTLLISPHQDHEKLKNISMQASSRHSILFVYNDFRVGFRESHEVSKRIGLYHQNYCGCMYSKEERSASLNKEQK